MADSQLGIGKQLPWMLIPTSPLIYSVGLITSLNTSHVYFWLWKVPQVGFLRFNKVKSRGGSSGRSSVSCCTKQLELSTSSEKHWQDRSQPLLCNSAFSCKEMWECTGTQDQFVRSLALMLCYVLTDSWTSKTWHRNHVSKEITAIWQWTKWWLKQHSMED